MWFLFCRYCKGPIGNYVENSFQGRSLNAARFQNENDKGLIRPYGTCKNNWHCKRGDFCSNGKCYDIFNQLDTRHESFQTSGIN